MADDAQDSGTDRTRATPLSQLPHNIFPWSLGSGLRLHGRNSHSTDDISHPDWHPAPLRIVLADWLFLAFAISCVVSIFLQPVDHKQIVLLAVSLAGYPAARGLSGIMVERAFAITLGIVVAIGVMITLFSINPSDPHGKPLIFGFDHGSIQLAMLLSLFVLSAACSQWRLISIELLLIPCAAVLAAAQVRFALLAMGGALVLGAIVAPTSRKRLLPLCAMLVVAVMVGLSLRPNVSIKYMDYARDSIVQSLPATMRPMRKAAAMPKAQEDGIVCGINIYNSIDMRKRLYAEAMALLPSAGLGGLGLGKFEELSCLKMEAHNTLLQVSIELGWISGFLIAALVMAAAWPLFPLAASRDDALLALLALAYAVAISLTAGRITDDIFLFLMIGYAAGTFASL